MMRLLFVVLLVANVAVLIWFEWLSPPHPALQVASPLSNTKPLTLLAELSPAEHQALVKAATSAALPPPAPAANPASPAAATVAVSAAVTAPVCVSYGPFPSTEAAQTGAARLQKAGASVSERLVPGKVRLGYWVYLPPFSSRHEAEAAATLLKQRGVKDLYVARDEANRNAISLGVFNQRKGAEERQQRIRKLGYHPVMTERFRDAPRYWLDARGGDGQLPPISVFTDLGEGDAAVTRQPAACGTVAPMR